MNVHLDPSRLWTPPTNGTVPPTTGRPRYTRDHTQLPYKDDSVVSNFLEIPQSFLLTTSLDPIFERLHAGGQFCIGGNNFIYFDDIQPQTAGAKAPDWFYVPGVPQTVDGVYRRSYVMWRERVPPFVVIEYASGNGQEERDATPKTGKFWAYEQAIRAEYYAIYEPDNSRVELFRLTNGRYETVPANDRGHFPIEPLGVELGIWHGSYRNITMGWLRAWDADGNLLPSADDRYAADQERIAADKERIDRLSAKLRNMGVDPDSV